MAEIGPYQFQKLQKKRLGFPDFISALDFCPVDGNKQEFEAGVRRNQVLVRFIAYRSDLV